MSQEIGKFLLLLEIFSFLKQQNFAGDLGQRTFDVFSLLKSEYRYKSMDLLFFRGFINFKTIYTFLEQRFDEKENFPFLEHLEVFGGFWRFFALKSSVM